MLPQLPLRIAVSVVSLSLVAVHLFFPGIVLDGVTLALAVIALLPWLQPIFKTVKLPGGIEITLQDMKQEIQAAVGAAQSAERKADLAVSGIVNPHSVKSDAASPGTHPLDTLARRYEDIRATMNSGPARTASMTAIVREMVEFAGEVPDETIPELLRSAKAGDRLAAYASLYGRPRPLLVEALVSSVTSREDKPFGQYWGLQAIGRNLPSTARDIPDSVVQDLSAFASRVPPGTDRDHEVQRLLVQIRGR
ncbi:hypothetical protein [Burkholderia sp. F1]|uniref:hypothetical protein n=1 Tax=Burkholderia sp. F1 TaxID=3366817 RepID=UPI003D71D6AF